MAIRGRCNLIRRAARGERDVKGGEKKVEKEAGTQETETGLKIIHFRVRKCFKNQFEFIIHIRPTSYIIYVNVFKFIQI